MPAPSAPSSFAVAATAIPWGTVDPSVNVAKNLISYPVNKAAVKVSWASGLPSDAQIRIETAPAGSGTFTFAGIAAPGTLSLVLPGLTRGASYDIRARSENSSGISSWSTISATVAPSFPTSITPPFTPASLTVVSTTSSKVTLSWTDSAGNEGFYWLTITGPNVPSYASGVVWIDPMATQVTVDLLDLLRVSTVAGQTFGAQLQTVGGPATVTSPPKIMSVGAATATFTMQPTSVRLVSVPANSQAYTAQAYTATITTDVNATSITATGLPAGLSISFSGPAKTATISGTATASPGKYAVTITATNASGSDSQVIYINVANSIFAFHDGQNLTLIATVGVAFTYTFNFDVVGTSTMTTLTAAGLPGWATLAGQVLSGTPTTASDTVVTLTATNGTLTASLSVHLVVPSVSITSAASASGYSGADINFALTSNPTTAVFSSDDVPAGVSISSASPQYLTGSPTAGAGTYSFTLTASVGDDFVQQAFTLTEQSAITGPSEFSISTSAAPSATSPNLAGPFNYVGAGVVRSWMLVGGPQGIGIASNSSEYGAVHPNSATISGATLETGIFYATVSCVVDTAASLDTVFSTASTDALTRFDFPVKIDVSGGLFIAWLHADPSIYDLQVPLRGDGGSRVVSSLYEIAPTAASQFTKYFGGGGDGSTSSTQIGSIAASPGRVLGIKDGDDLKLAIVIRDGNTFPTNSVLSDVNLVLRLPDGEDDEPVFTGSGTWTPVGSNGYFLIEIKPGSELDDLLDESGLQSIALKGELEWKYNGQRMSSQAFDATYFENIVPLTV